MAAAGASANAAQYVSIVLQGVRITTGLASLCLARASSSVKPAADISKNSIITPASITRLHSDCVERLSLVTQGTQPRDSLAASPAAAF
jgi:hypothetical protein